MPRTIRPIRIEGNLAYVTLTKGYTAVIDADDVSRVDGVNWCAMVKHRRDGSIRTIYASRRVSRNHLTIYMHRVIAGTPDGMDTDHIDGDGLNNQRKNLRPATKSQNQHNQTFREKNSSGCKGVTWHKAGAKWQAAIKAGGGSIYLGLFSDIDSARDAYAKASKQLHGAFGRTS